MIEHASIRDSISFTKKEKGYVAEVISDFWTCIVSREVSLLGRKEVLTGKAKFGILGDGKEVPQVAMARAFKKGDFRCGYYRDQTFMFALGLSRVEDFFAQLYADPDNDPFSGGRQMNSHYATALKDENDQFLDHKNRYNITSDISSTGGQMARALGIALASKKFRKTPSLNIENKFSENGNEICFCTIGDASTSEGVFWETMNAASVMKAPLAVSVWDDGYGISVPIELQTVKANISKALEGFALDENGNGLRIHTVKGWDYPQLCIVYEKAVAETRKDHSPVLIHVMELTQPQGHSTSGSHERYKSKERLEWEKKHDCIEIMAQWMIDNKIATAARLKELRAEAKSYVKTCKDRAWANFSKSTKNAEKVLSTVFDGLDELIKQDRHVIKLNIDLNSLINPFQNDILAIARKMKLYLSAGFGVEIDALNDLIKVCYAKAHDDFHTHLYSNADSSALNVPVLPAIYSEDSKKVTGYQILNSLFDTIFEERRNVFAFGEDVGRIGDVNQGFAGLQEKYGRDRIFDCGIREWTIMGQAIGMAMRGLRPIAEIQYLDYFIYGLAPLSDDLATLRYRSDNLQMAPAIIRTRGHRLEGIWHAGSPMAMLINALRGIYIMVPRNMVQAAGMYNTMLESTDPGIIIECLNGYRLRERMPDNLSEFTVPLGVPEVLAQGDDVTLVTYGSCVRVAERALEMCEVLNVSVELIDVQTLLPFDLESTIVESIKKTNRVIFFDEDVPGGASAYMMQEVLEKQGAYQYLDSKPMTISAFEHRTPFGSDGDYFTKPNPEDLFEKIVELVREAEPERFM